MTTRIKSVKFGAASFDMTEEQWESFCLDNHVIQTNKQVVGNCEVCNDSSCSDCVLTRVSILEDEVVGLKQNLNKNSAIDQKSAYSVVVRQTKPDCVSVGLVKKIFGRLICNETEVRT